MESTPHWSPRASSNTVSCSFSYHTWQFIIFTFSTITACIISYSFRISFRTQDLALQQILSYIELFLFYRTDYTDSRTMLNGCTGKCVRLSRPLVGFWTHFKSLHFHFISFHFISSDVELGIKSEWSQTIWGWVIHCLLDVGSASDWPLLPRFDLGRSPTSENQGLWNCLKNW